MPLVSAIPGVTPYDNSVILSEEEIARLVECWGKAAIRAREAGFDAVEIHGAHGYLISQFLSPYTNRRTDGYGGSLENRMHFALEVCRKVRESVGPDFPVTYRMSAVEGLPGGTTLEDSVALQAAGSRRHRRFARFRGAARDEFHGFPARLRGEGLERAPFPRRARRH